MGETYKRPDSTGGWVLGLDLGVASIGWAAVAIETGRGGTPDPHRPHEILDAGVRIFDAGSGSEADYRRAKDQSHAIPRREARSQRRLTWRRRRRVAKVFHQLVRAGLLPNSDSDTPESRHRTIAELDRQLATRWCRDGNHVDHQRLPYLLRAAAATPDRPVTDHELGRALFHLAQRRGFKSNRKADRGIDDEDAGVVKADINELSDAMEAAGTDTLGKYLASIDPTDPDVRRIRGRRTSRQMYLDEFDAIIRCQREHHATLQERDFVRDIRRAIFDQRPLKPATGLIGRCDLLPDRRRMSKRLPAFQEFRLRQLVDNLRIDFADGNGPTELNNDQRETLIDHLHRNGDTTWTAVRKLIGVPKPNRETGFPKINLERTPDNRGGQPKLIGDRTSAAIVKAIGDDWFEWNEVRRRRMASALERFETDEELIEHLQTAFDLDTETATALTNVRLESGYANYSAEAVEAILERMRSGERFDVAKAYLETLWQEEGRRAAKPDAMDLLPPQGVAKSGEDNVYPPFKNPAVARCIGEMRKVVNALIRRYGKPDFIRVEVTRDLKNSRSRRDAMLKRRNENEKRRAKAAEAVLSLSESAVRPSRRDIERWMLAEECGFVCPYTNRPIQRSWPLDPEFEVEHIVPLSRSLDNSFANKTLAHRDANAQKKNKTPIEAFETIRDGDGPLLSFDQMLQNVARFNSPWARRKMQLFQTRTEDIEGFAKRQLNDTAYISRAAHDYLQLLYSDNPASPHFADPDNPGRVRVAVVPGRVTAYLRNAWDLREVTGGPGKSRDDHRHHAVDALVIALTQFKTLQDLARAAAETREAGRRDRLTAELDPPYHGFLDDAREAYDRIIVSSRPNRKLNGPLHNETLFSPRKHGSTGSHHQRVDLTGISLSQIGQIVDKRIREIIQQHFENNDRDLKLAFADPTRHPRMRTRRGRWVPIHRVRIAATANPTLISDRHSPRYAVPNSNQRLEIIETQRRGKTKWIGKPVTRLDAVRDHARWKKVHDGNTKGHRPPGPTQPPEGEGKLVMVLAPGDHVLLNLDDEGRVLCRVNSISEKDIELQRHNDARAATVLRKSGDRIRRSPDTLQRDGVEKVDVTPLGEIVPVGGP